MMVSNYVVADSLNYLMAEEPFRLTHYDLASGFCLAYSHMQNVKQIKSYSYMCTTSLHEDSK